MGLEAATWLSVEIAAEKDADIGLAQHVVGTLDGTGSP